MVGQLQNTRILRVLANIAMRVWAISGAALLGCFLLFWVYGGVLPFLLLIFATTGILYHAEDQLLYHPELPSHSRVFVPIPTMFGLPYENVYIRSADGTLIHLFYIRRPDEQGLKAPTIVFFHGNAGNMGHRLQNAAGLYQNLQCNVLLVEYRGYGLSEGSANEEGICMDARAAMDYLSSRRDVNHSEIIVFGRSLGGAVAIDLACRPEYADKIACLIIENTFTSIPDMAKVLLSWKLLQYLPLCCYKNKFLSIYKIPMLRVPILFISGLADTLVPPRMMSELHSRCSSERKQLVQFQTGTHNETWTCQGYYRTVALFIQDMRMRQQTVPSSQGESHIKKWNNIHDV